MSSEEKKMKPNWHFVGLVLVVMGAVIFLAGLISPGRAQILGHLRTNLWWGLVMIAAGLIFLFTNRKARV